METKKAAPLLALVAAPVLVLALVLVAMFGSPTPSQRQARQPGLGSFCAPGVAGGSPVGTSSATGAWVTPLQSAYRTTSKYGWRKNPTGGPPELHGGQDLKSFEGDTVVAATSGTVSDVIDFGGRSYGLHIKIDHPGGVRTLYAHLQKATVKAGQQVAAGQPIGALGNSGRSTGAHLHFEVRVNNKHVDPVPWMADKGAPLNGKPTKPSGAAPTADAAAAAIPQRPVVGVDRSGSMSENQLANASTIIQVGQELGLPEQAWVVALVTAMQESQLGDYGPAKRPNSDGDTGVFQQRAKVGWYADGRSMEENTAILADTAYAARTFYLGHDVGVFAAGGAGRVGYHIPGLLDIKGWESMPVTMAAQKVQVSAFPMAYAKWEATARSLVATLASGTPCSQGETAAGAAGVVVNLPANATAGQKVVAAAMSQLGVPYSWAGGDASGPTTGGCCSPGGHSGARTVGFDCSGLTVYAWAKAGVKLPRTARTQHRAVTPVPVDQIQAGDLLFFSNDAHVGIADGKGGMIHAPRTGKNVEVVPNVLKNSYWGETFGGAGRPSNTGGN